MKKWLLASLFLMSFSVFAQDRTISVKHLNGAQSYFQISVEDEGLLKGVYPGWCADWAEEIEDDTIYPVKFYSSLREDFPEGVVDNPDYLDEVNWLINENFTGRNAPQDLGAFTSGDIQLAIWTLIDDSFETTRVGPYSQERVDLLVEWAKTKGSDFYPTCHQKVSLILDPGVAQATLIEIRRDHFRKCAVPEGDEVK